MDIRAVLVVSLLVISGGVPAAAVAQEGEETATVTLTVAVEDRNGDPVPDAELNAEWDGGSTTARTAANGKAFLDVPEGAAVEIDVAHSEYVRNRPYTVEDASERPVTIDVARRGALAVSVTDDAGPLAEANVVVRHDGRIVASGRTGSSGEFRTGWIERGDYSVGVAKAGYYDNRTVVGVDGEVRESVRLGHGSVVVDFHVRDAHYDPHRPVGGVTLALESIGEFRTLPNGEATARVPVNTDHTLRIDEDEYAAIERRFRVAEEARTVTVNVSRAENLTLDPLSRRVVAGEPFTVEVTDEYDEPVANATVLADDEEVAQTDRRGRASVALDATGSHSLRARSGRVDSAAVTVEAVSSNASPEEPTADASATQTAAATASETDFGTDSETDGDGPGFGAVAALVAVAALAALAAGRTRR